jgi:surfeit locus 1 family protein
VPNLPNNHLQYVVTWYGLALVLVVSFLVWAFKSRRTERRST